MEHDGVVFGVAFSPDGKRVASVSDNKVRLWDVQNIEHIRFIGKPLEGHRSPVSSVAFSPNGNRLASASIGSEGEVRLWDIKDIEHIQPLGGTSKDNAGAESVVFSADGKRLASASWDNTVRLWNAENGQPLDTPLKGHEAPVLNVAFSSDGKRLASASMDSSVQIWDTDPRSWQQRACVIAKRNLTREEWRRYIGDQHYHKTCPDLPGPDGAPQAAALQSPPGAGKAPSAESASAPTEAPGPAVTAPPVIPPARETHGSRAGRRSRQARGR
jgi:dipeptidyl aminopeptidase/acylaminoacyl peptidase